MSVFEEFISGIDDSDHRERMEEVLSWVHDEYPNMERVVKWNQPMFTDHGTYIIGFSVAKKHMSVAPENKAIEEFGSALEEVGYVHTRQIFRIPWDGEVDYALLKRIIEFNIGDKAGVETFWR
ncbi:iron chaperone [Salinicoccus roseus]|uniref:Iron chaperone n=1 Tax=Salinicoccus roseus TaxID=45670 RepID=A0A0C2E909_9STAP|nr:iron chaperone [Salinicoccus roseus]KIH71752.1 iron chaperone [Salinicoccus roseus]MDB0579863.1 iron chaperone [Salinicoccus roseus]